MRSRWDIRWNWFIRIVMTKNELRLADRWEWIDLYFTLILYRNSELRIARYAKVTADWPSHILLVPFQNSPEGSQVFASGPRQGGQELRRAGLGSESTRTAWIVLQKLRKRTSVYSRKMAQKVLGLPGEYCNNWGKEQALIQGQWLRKYSDCLERIAIIEEKNKRLF